jgi:S-adenosyl-L-methionine hydrolase (adenosine-forming)
MATYTITSDFGEQNYLAAAVKGCIYSADNNARITTISNNIQAFNVYQAAYVFRSAFRYFPSNTHHLLLCGLHNSDHTTLLVSKVLDQYVYHVDNELAYLAFEHHVDCFALRLENTFEYRVGNIATAFAQASALINKGVLLQDFATPYQLKEIPKDLKVIERETELTAHVLYIDKFSNVVLNLRKQKFDDFRRGRNFSIHYVGNESITEISEHYSSVQMGQKLAFFNDAGYLEIAIRGGAASKLFGFEAPQFKEDSLDFDFEENAIYKTVTIRFSE